IAVFVADEIFVNEAPSERLVHGVGPHGGNHQFLVRRQDDLVEHGTTSSGSHCLAELPPKTLEMPAVAGRIDTVLGMDHDGHGFGPELREEGVDVGIRLERYAP